MIHLEVSRHAPGETKQNHETPQDNRHPSIIKSIPPYFCQRRFIRCKQEQIIGICKAVISRQKPMGLMSYKARIIHIRLAPDLTYLTGSTFFSPAQGDCDLLTKII
jgi:hypothetical protein